MQDRPDSLPGYTSVGLDTFWLIIGLDEAEWLLEPCCSACTETVNGGQSISIWPQWSVVNTSLLYYNDMWAGWCVATMPSLNLESCGCSTAHRSMPVITWQWAGTPTNQRWL